jgi:hypothetical protein
MYSGVMGGNMLIVAAVEGGPGALNIFVFMAG